MPLKKVLQHTWQYKKAPVPFKKSYLISVFQLLSEKLDTIFSLIHNELGNYLECNFCNAQLHDIKHFINENLDEAINIFHATEKFNIHSSEMQKNLNKKSKKYSFLRLVTEYPRQFLKYYFFKGMIFAGKQGFIYASSHAYFRFLKIAKNIEEKSGSDLK